MLRADRGAAWAASWVILVQGGAGAEAADLSLALVAGGAAGRREARRGERSSRPAGGEARGAQQQAGGGAREAQEASGRGEAQQGRARGWDRGRDAVGGRTGGIFF